MGSTQQRSRIGLKEDGMRRHLGLALIATLLCVSLAVWAQADLDAFPVGTTTMRYQVTAEDFSEPQVLELVVTAHDDGRYTVRMVTEQTGDADELEAGFGFLFGATRVSSGGGHDVSYTSLEALMDQRSRLQEGQEYLLPSGGTFTDISGVTIADVWCLQGVLINPDEPDSRLTVAFALTHPVYISPRILAEELRDGEWVEVFALELVEYVVAEGG
jgi:hypothetical protein